jgi:hypothetical protein
MRVDRARDRPVSVTGFVLVDHRRALAVMSHAGHQVPDANPAGSSETVAGMA